MYVCVCVCVCARARARARARACVYVCVFVCVCVRSNRQKHSGTQTDTQKDIQTQEHVLVYRNCQLFLFPFSFFSWTKTVHRQIQKSEYTDTHNVK